MLKLDLKIFIKWVSRTGPYLPFRKFILYIYSHQRNSSNDDFILISSNHWVRQAKYLWPWNAASACRGLHKLSRRSWKDKWPLGNDRHDQPFGFILFDRSNHSWNFLSQQLLITMQPSNKTILERSIGRPAMMAFVLLTGIYLTTGQLIPGVV